MESIPISKTWWDGDDLMIGSPDGRVIRLENAKQKGISTDPGEEKSDG